MPQFPFWTPFLGSRRDWDALEADCPGVNRGKLHSKEEIMNWVEARGKDPFLTDKDVEGCL